MSLDINKLMEERQEAVTPQSDYPFYVGERISLPNRHGDGGWVGNVVSFGTVDNDEYKPTTPPFDVTVVYAPNLEGHVFKDFQPHISRGGSGFVGFPTKLLRKLNRR